MLFTSNLVTSILAFHDNFHVSGCGDMCGVWSSYKTTKGKVHFRVIKTLHTSQSTEVNVCIYMDYLPSVRSIWLHISHAVLCVFNVVEVHKHAKKKNAANI